MVDITSYSPHRILQKVVLITFTQVVVITMVHLQMEAPMVYTVEEAIPKQVQH